VVGEHEVHTPDDLDEWATVVTSSSAGICVIEYEDGSENS
jgi:hypothetical protein